MTTTLAVPGLFGTPSLQMQWYQERLTTVGNTVPSMLGVSFDDISDTVGVSYNWFLPNTAPQNIDAALHALPPGEQAIVLGHSEGALGIWKWLKDYAPTSDIDPAMVLWLSSGSGDKIKSPAPWLVNSDYKLVDVTKEWDEIADPANVPSSPYYDLANDNANALKTHTTGYQPLDLTGAHRTKTIGSITYLFYDTYDVTAVSPTTRDQLETAYYRPYLADLSVGNGTLSATTQQRFSRSVNLSGAGGHLIATSTISRSLSQADLSGAGQLIALEHVPPPPPPPPPPSRDTLAPTVTVIPLAGNRHHWPRNRWALVHVTTADNVKVTGIEIWLDGQLMKSVPSVSVVWGWFLGGGDHVLTVKAFDKAGNVGVITKRFTR